MPVEISNQLINFGAILPVLKIGFLAVVVFYLIFTALVLRQLKVMEASLKTRFAPALSFAAVLQVLMAFLFLVSAIFLI